jgi:hypothetical protein
MTFIKVERKKEILKIEQGILNIEIVSWNFWNDEVLMLIYKSRMDAIVIE